MKISINTFDIKIRKTSDCPKGGAHQDKKNEYKRQEKHPKKSFESYMRG